MARKRELLEKHNQVVTKDLPMQATIQQWEVELRKRKLPLRTDKKMPKKKEITIPKIDVKKVKEKVRNEIA